MVAEFVAYYRVSTNRQGESGLGLEAQRDATLSYVAEQDAVLIEEFTEVESGRRSDRPKLKEALDLCRKNGATLLIAKLDRLARNVHFISGLLETNVRFVAVDMPNADRFMLHVYAAIAECASSDNLRHLSGFPFGGSGSSLIDFMRFQFCGASAG